MKKQAVIILFTVLISALITGCSKNDSLNRLSLKEAIKQGSKELNYAMDAITSSRAYSVFTMSDGGFKSAETDSVYKVYIPLESIKGVYEYKPVVKVDHHGRSIMQFFNKTADNTRMIVRMPLTKISHPRSLRQYSSADSALANNFSIAVSEYHNNYNSFWDYDYALASEISIDNAVAGNLNIQSLVSRKNGIHYASQYAFTDGYTAKYKYESGDTIVSSFSITGDDKILYEEKLLTIKNDSARFGREHLYILTISDVQIARNAKNRTVEVSVNGVLQPNATVTIVDKDSDPEASVCKKREILITFEDGTQATVSELIGKSVDSIKTLFDSLHQVYFAAYVVDWIAYDIYYQRN